MKLRTLAVAILATSISAPVFADGHEGLKLSGMARVDYTSGDDNPLTNPTDEALTTKVELNLDASAESNGITYFGHAQLEGTGAGGGAGNNVSTDDIYVGMKGGFGEVRLGDTDNGCDVTDVGGYPDEMFGSVAIAGCAGSDQNNITYIGSAGAVSYAASFSPENNADNFSIGAKGKFGAASVSLGHTAGDGVLDTTILGLAGSFGAFGVGLQVSDVDGASDNPVEVHASYAAGANKFVLGVADTGSSNPISGYWRRDLGGNTFFHFEVQDSDDNGDTDVGLRLQHNF